MTLSEMIEHCQKRGKMTALEAQRLRSSIHIFVGAMGVKNLSLLMKFLHGLKPTARTVLKTVL